jgi:hypothetical protein
MLHLMMMPARCAPRYVATIKSVSACAGKCNIHNVDQIGTVPAALTAYLALQVWPLASS